MHSEEFVAGVDEVGRGPLAGPVIAAAVIIKTTIPGVTDSKKISAIRRKKLSEMIKINAVCYAFGRAEVDEIDELNIHHATLLAMKRAIIALPTQPQRVLVDGIHTPDIHLPCEAIVKGDLLIPAISAASILAKVARDEEMCEFDSVFPGYGFSSHKGYPTAAHVEALTQLGPTPIHRKSFSPVAKLLINPDFQVACT